MIRVLVVFAVVSALTGCGAGDDVEATERFNESGVTVDVTVHIGPNGDGLVTATFTPDRPGFHVYSIDLPSDGMDGLGRPTRVAVTGGLSATGKQHADKPLQTLRLSGVDDVGLPVYPDGQVTITLPVHRSAASSSVLISYAACSESEGCLMPVTDKAVPVT